MKKDPNYLAAVEKAISEKYGRETIQDFRSQWPEEKEKDYLKQLKEMKVRYDKLSKNREETTIGDIVITKSRSHQKENRTCPVCKTYSFSGRDDLYMNRFKTCYHCYFEFVEHNEEKWDNGWRPSVEQLSAALRRRK